MTFRYTNAYIGPFCVSYAQGKEGEIQKFRFPLPVISRDHISQGLMITEGDIEIKWSHGEDYGGVMGVGGSFALDGPGVPFAINTEATLKALGRCAFLCVTAAGIEQKVFLERYRLAPGETMVAERYALVAVAGPDAEVRVNGGEVRKGIRLVYGRSGETTVEAVTPTVVGKFQFAG